MKTMKFFLSFILIFSILSSISSCNQNNKKSSYEPKKIENYFTVNDMFKNKNIDNIIQAKMVDESIFLIGDSISDTNTGETACFIDTETNEITKLPIPKEIESSTIIGYKNEKIYLTSYEYNNEKTFSYLYELNKEDMSIIKKIELPYDDTTHIPIIFKVNEAGEIFLAYKAFGKAYFKVYDVLGNEKHSIVLDYFIPNYENSDENYFSTIAISPENDIYLFESTAKDFRVHIFDDLLKYKETASFGTIPSVQRAFFTKSGSLLLSYYEFNNENEDQLLLVDEIDIETKSIKTQYELYGMYFIYEGNDLYDCFYYKDNAIYGYNFENGDKKIIENLNLETDKSNNEPIIPYCISVYENELFFSSFFPQSSNELTCVKTNLKGVEESVFLISPQQNGYVDKININFDKTISYLEVSNNIYINNLDKNSNISSSINLNEITNFHHISDFIKDESNNFVFWGKSTEENKETDIVFIIDSSGNLLYEFNDVQNIIHLFKLNKEGVIISYLEDQEIKYIKLNIDEKTFEKGYQIHGFRLQATDIILNGNKDYDLFISNSKSLLGYDLENQKSTEIINYFDSDIDGNIQNAFAIDSNTILCKIIDNNLDDKSNNFHFILSRVDEETLKNIQNKSLIVAAGININKNIFTEAIKFNKSNDKFKIKIVDYSNLDNISIDNLAIQELNKDLIQGNIPDIIISNSYMNIQPYINKNIFSDLNVFFDSDPYLKKEEYIKNILSAFETNEKLYQIPPSFSINSFIGNEDVLGENFHWNFDNFLEFAKNNTDKKIFNINSPKELLYHFFILNTNEFIDFDGGKCYFENENFINLIEFINNYCKNTLEINDETPPLLQIDNIYSYKKLNEIEKSFLYDLPTFKGAPSSKNLGTSISYENAFSISKKSKNQKGAWSFIKIFLEYNYQEKIYNLNNEFPLSSYSINKISEKSKGIQNNAEPIDKNQIEKTNHLIYSTNNLMHYDENIFKIISEETDLFFIGDRNAQDTAKLIQNRITTYINEIQ